MKKTYIAPVCEIVKLNAADIIATSDVHNEMGNGQQLGRGSDGWEDDF